MYGGSETVINLAEGFSAHFDNIKVFFNCLNTLWTYNHSNHTGWVQIRYKGIRPGNRCFHQAHVFGNKMLLTGGCSNEFAI